MNLLALQRGLSGVLTPVSTLYGLLMAARRRMWENDTLKRLDPSCLCVSVGNISWGGTGKTPLVEWLVEHAVDAGLHPVVLTRGYKATVAHPPALVTKNHNPREVGDEPLMLALNNPLASVVVDPDRRRSGDYALKSLNPDMLILDDGFQHLPVKRHLDIVLLRPADVQDQWNNVIPGGSWRENTSALTHADVFCIKISPEEFATLEPHLRKHLRSFERPVFSFSLRPTGLRRVDASGTARPEHFGGRPYALVTGVGNPQQVRADITRYMGYAPEHHLEFPDHHDYEYRDTKKMEALHMPILCTPKDEVKLRRLPVPNLWSVCVEVVFGPSLWAGVSFPEWWTRWHAAAAQAIALPAFEKPASGFVPDFLEDISEAISEGFAEAAQEAEQEAAPKTGQEAECVACVPMPPPQPIQWATPPRPRHTPEPPRKIKRAPGTPTPPRPKTPSLPGS